MDSGRFRLDLCPVPDSRRLAGRPHAAPHLPADHSDPVVAGDAFHQPGQHGLRLHRHSPDGGPAGSARLFHFQPGDDLMVSQSRARHRRRRLHLGPVPGAGFHHRPAGLHGPRLWLALGLLCHRRRRYDLGHSLVFSLSRSARVQARQRRRAGGDRGWGAPSWIWAALPPPRPNSPGPISSLSSSTGSCGASISASSPSPPASSSSSPGFPPICRNTAISAC